MKFQKKEKQMNYFKLFIIIFVLLLSKNSTIRAGAWTQKVGGYYFKIETSYLKASKEFNHKGDELNILEEQFIYKDASFRDISIRAYAEYGLIEDLTLVGKIPFKIYTTQYNLDDLYSQGKVARSTTGLGDLSVGLKYGLLNQPLALALQGGIKIPMGYEKQPANDGPRLGTGEIDFEGMLMLGQSLHPLPMYVGGGIGYRKRGGSLHDEIIYNFETGYTLKNWFFKIYFNGIKNTETPPDLYGGEIQLPLPGGGGVTPDLLFGDLDLNQISFTISHLLQEGMSIEATIYEILSGKNTASGRTFSLGLAIYK
jgi:outer membrane putative beta-barrel porin/alpha-amylase